MSPRTGKAPAVVVAVLLTCTSASASPERASERGSEGRNRDRALSERRLKEALRRYRHEPPIDRVVAAALNASGADPDRARALAERARRGGWVPSVHFGVRHGQGRDLFERRIEGRDDRTGQSADDELTLDGELRFELPDVVYRSDEVRLLREERSLRRERAELVENVVRLYFERRRLQLERDLLRGGNIERTVRIAEIEALLDRYTGGAFTRAIRGAR